MLEIYDNYRGDSSRTTPLPKFHIASNLLIIYNSCRENTAKQIEVSARARKTGQMREPRDVVKA